MSIERVNDAIEATRAITETLEQTTEATQFIGDRLEHYTDYGYGGLAAVMAQDVDQEILSELQPTIDPAILGDIVVGDGARTWGITADIVNVQPMIGFGDGPINTTAGIGFTNEPLQENIDPNAAPPAVTLNSVYGGFSLGYGSISLNYGGTIEIAKSKIKPKPVLNPKTVTRRVLNMAEEGWVVK